MRTGLKTPSTYYLELITSFPPRSIKSEVELIATQARINFILDKGQLNQDERDYIKILGMLVDEYEEKHEPMPKIKGIELLKALLEETNLQPKDLVTIFGSETIILDVLQGKKQMTEEQAQKLNSSFL